MCKHTSHDVLSYQTACVKRGVSRVMSPAVLLAVIGRPGRHGRHVTVSAGQEYSNVTGQFCFYFSTFSLLFRLN